MHETPRISWVSLGGRIALLSLAYFVTGRLALLLAIPPGFATAIFPPVGLGLAAVLLWGKPLALGVLVGSTALNLSISVSAGAPFSARTCLIALGIAIGSTVHSLVGSWLVRRFVGFPTQLSDGLSSTLFLLLGGPVASALSASFGVSALMLGGILSPTEVLFSWLTWWVGDSTGVMIAGTLIIVLFSEPRAQWQGRRATVGIPLLLGSLLMVVIFVRVSRDEQRRIASDFHARAKRMATAIEFHFDLHDEALQSVARLFVVAPKSTRDDFRVFVDAQKGSYRGTQAIVWAPVIREDERAAHERAMAEQGAIGFTIREQNEKGELIPAKPRDEHVVVTYIEPMKGNDRAIGFDIVSEEKRIQALSAARDAGRAILTPPVRLVQDTEPRMGVLFVFPVYTTRDAPKTVEERRRSLRGYTLSALRIDELARTALAEYDAADYVVRIFDITRESERGLLAGPEELNVPSYAESLVFRHEWHARERVFEISIAPTARFLQSHKSMQSWLVLVGGLLLCSLLGAFLLVVSGRAVSVQQIVDERTSELRAVLDNAAEAILTFDEQGKIERSNPATTDLFGYREAELLGRHIRDLLPGLDWTAVPKGAVAEEVPGVHRDGQALMLEMGLSQTKLRGRIVYTCMLHDISERKRVERLKNEFVSTVSHELRTPLTSISGSLGLLAGGVVGEIPAEARELIDIAIVNTQRLRRLVDDILDIEKLESAQMELEIKRLDLRELLQACVEENTGYADQFGVKLSLESNEGLAEPIFVEADSLRVAQVLANLVSNAIKFSPKDGLVRIQAHRRDGFAHISVEDHGSGIPEAFRPRIFEKFAQADGTDTRERGGTGLGLSISKAIVECLGGKIGFESTIGKGTTFTFTLPLAAE